jgi:hypothetical protein
MRHTACPGPIHKSCGDTAPRDFFAHDDHTILIQANHMQSVLAGIDPNGMDGYRVRLL